MHTPNSYHSFVPPPARVSQVQGLLGSGSGSAAQGLREDLASSLDEPLVRQMVARDALGGGDLRPMLDRLMDVLAVLLAPVRLEAFRRWRDTFTTLAFPTNTPTTSIVTVPAENTALSGSTNTTSTGSLIGPATTTTAAVSGPLSSKRSLVALAPLLGPFCEFVALTVEEVGGWVGGRVVAYQYQSNVYDYILISQMPFINNYLNLSYSAATVALHAG